MLQMATAPPQRQFPPQVLQQVLQMLSRAGVSPILNQVSSQIIQQVQSQSIVNPLLNSYVQSDPPVATGCNESPSLPTTSTSADKVENTSTDPLNDELLQYI